MAANKVTIEIEARFTDGTASGVSSAEGGIKRVTIAAEDAQSEIDALGQKLANISRRALDVQADKLTAKIRSAEEAADKLTRTKATIKLQAVDKATAVINSAISAGNRFQAKIFQGAIKVRDSGALNTLNSVADKAKSIAGKTWEAIVKVKDTALAPLTKIKNMLFNIKTLIGAIAAGWAANKLFAEPTALADTYSGAKIGFQTLLGETQGQQMMNNLDQFAKETPFTTSGVIENAQKMIAMGWDAENIIKDMETIGDAAAATGKGTEGLSRIVLALSQIKSKGKLSTEELNQLAEAGISAKRYLAEGLGYGSGDAGIAALSKDLQKGAIGSEAAIEAIMQGMKEYDGMMEKTANETVSGLKSQLEDTFEINIARRWGQGLQDGAKRGLGTVVTLLDSADDALSKFGDMVYEVGSALSNFAADKLENAVSRITEITDSYEWQNADLKGKFKLLWEGVVTDPLKEWWENGGRESTAETAGEIGTWTGNALSSALKGILGMTDALDGKLDTSELTDGAASIGQSFAQGFVDNFDVSGVTDKLLEAVNNVWGALPAWAKLLVGGYAVGKAAGGISKIAGGVAQFASSGIGGAALKTVGGIGGTILGSTGNAMVAGSGLLGKLASAGYATTGGAANAAGYFGAAGGLSGGAAAALGLGSVAGGAASAIGAGKGIYDLYKAVEAHRMGDKTESKARSASGVSALGGVAAGAAAGAAIGSVVPVAGTAAGALIGGGIGAVAGLWGGSKWAKKIRSDAEAAKYETEEMQEAIKDTDATAEELAQTLEKAAWNNLRDNFGDIELSMSEIGRLATQIVQGSGTNLADTFTSAASQASAGLESLQTATDSIAKWEWKAKLGVTFNDDEIETIETTVDDYITAAQSYIENKHYEFTAAVTLLLGTDENGIISSGDAYYQEIQAALDEASSGLSNELKIALQDGVITLDEQAELENLQNQIAEITNKLADAETDAKLETIKIEFGEGNISYESFSKLQAELQSTLNEQMSSYKDALTASITNLNLQLADDAIDEEEYQRQLQELTDGYDTKVDDLNVKVANVQLDILGSAYEGILGEDATTKLRTALQDAIQTGTDPIEWDSDYLKNLLDVDALSGESSAALTQALQSILDSLPDSLDKTVKLGVTVERNVLLTDTGKSLSSALDIPAYTPNSTKLRASAKGNSIRGYADGGLVGGSERLIRVAEGGNPEMIIPLSAQSRDRGLKLWEQAGNMLGIRGYADGGLVGGGSQDEGIRFARYAGSGSASGGQTVHVEMGGVTVEIHVDASGAGGNVAQTLRDQMPEIAEEVAGQLYESLSALFENTPTRGGVA